MGRKAAVATNPTLASPAVDGLDFGRERARRRAGRRRFKNTVVSVFMFAVVAGAVGVAGYFLWEFYSDERDKQAETVVTPERSTEEWIDELEEQPRWNGPGNPTFGVGGEPSP